jgi:hypothetical protein
VIAKALHEVDNAESILKTKNLIALFMQTMNVSGSSPSPPAAAQAGDQSGSLTH